MSRATVPGHDAVSAKAKDGSGAILTMGDAMSVFSQTAAANMLIDVSQARGL